MAKETTIYPMHLMIDSYVHIYIYISLSPPWVNYNDPTATSLFSLTGFLVRLREIIPKWPNNSG